MIYKTKSTEETEEIGRILGKKLDTGPAVRCFIAMRGEMGVGKTAFVRGLASHFGIRTVKSPTYTIVNEYRGRVPIYHFDTYRIESEDDLYSIGFFDYVDNGICLVEWSENIVESLPDRYVRVELIKNDAENTDSRLISMTLVG